MGEKEDWWQSFFSGLWLDVHGRVRTEEDTRAEVEFAAHGLSPGARVLDVPCGMGRHSLELAARGFRVTGVDVTPAMLARAREGALARKLEVEWREADMRDLPFDAEFDLAINLFGSFGYFDEDGNERFLEAVGRALRPAAKLAIETHVFESLMPKFQEKGWRWAGDVRVIEERRFDLSRSRVDVEWTFLRGSEAETRRTSIRIYTVRELQGLLEDAGFEGFELYASPDRQPFKVGSPRLFLVATRSA
ncbi:class I SAM-dependent methyltransferase [bacterium]|nr:class I SAM-dependent methyltransferase [bacterium]